MFQISKSEIIGRLGFDNPWWEEGASCKVPYQEQPRRKYFDSFLKTVVDRSLQRAVVLMGPRRVGKTVMIYQVIRSLLDSGVEGKNILYLSIETPIYTGLALEKIIGYFQEQFNHARETELFIIFDEIQYLKDWEIHLKSLVDSYRSYKFIATGSAAAALRMKSQESGAGRFSDYILPPLTFAEYLTFINRADELIEVSTAQLEDPEYDEGRLLKYSAKNIEELNSEFINYLNYGGYPEAVFNQTIRSDPSQYIKSDIIDKVLLRDLPSLYGISDIQELNRLFTTLAYNSGNEVSLENISKTSGVAKNTIKRYIDYLEAAFLLRRVDRIDHNAKRFKRAMCFKAYLTNPSMRAALFGPLKMDSEAMGNLTETAIYSQWQHSKATSLYYARWPSGEVDIVCLESAEQKPQWAVEVKWSDRPLTSRSELDNCVEFANRNPSIHRPILITSRTKTDKIEYAGVQFNFMPASLYCYILGVNILGSMNIFDTSEI